MDYNEWLTPLLCIFCLYAVTLSRCSCSYCFSPLALNPFPVIWGEPFQGEGGGAFFAMVLNGSDPDGIILPSNVHQFHG